MVKSGVRVLVLGSWSAMGLGLVACGGGGKPAPAKPVAVAPPPAPAPAPAPPPTPADDDVAKGTAFRDRMCACADAACSDAVMKDLMAWAQPLSSKYQRPEDAPPALVSAMHELSDCAAKVPSPVAGKVVEMRDKMCACTDADCAGKVMEEMAKLGDSFGRDYRPSQAEAKAASEMAECMQKLMK
ncbi:MAG: hypothetical protein K8W52_47410 [Deltaproteobacteria bacterium]|nr:hypothetical protein [Deltaproteobacteria bacterium]